MKRVITSGYFNPLHGGHLDLIEGSRALGDSVLIVVNNDKQQIIKKGKIILDQDNRMRLMRALRDVDDVMLSVDEDGGQAQTLRKIRETYPDDELIFAKGGDRNPDSVGLPEAELAVCDELGISIVYGVGSHDVEKRDSSSRINQLLGHEA